MNHPFGRDRHVVVVGGGITGLAAARTLLTQTHPPRVTVLEAEHRLGGKIRTTPFAGLPAVDEGADAYLVRVPWARDLAREVGLERRLTSPATRTAAIWHGKLHRIPAGLVLGVPAGVTGLIRSGLLSPRGLLRAGTEVVRPATPRDDDSLGSYVRSRFGREVHERLVDPLIGSIYATDTDHFSLSAVPQIADLVGSHRSLLVAARRARGASATSDGPVFEAPIGGVGELVAATSAAVAEMGAIVRTGDPGRSIEPDGDGWRVNGELADAVILATSAHDAAAMAGRAAPAAASALRSFDYADVAIVALAVAGSSWPHELGRYSGYLVPRDVQRRVTAVTFGSAKWAHWRPPDGRVVLRVSLGRDRAPLDDLDDAGVVDTAISEINGHLHTDLQPSAVRVSRWPRAFAQYRPHHFDKVTKLEHLLARDAPGLFVAGASYRGMGIPACVQQGTAAALGAITYLQNR